MSKIKSLLKDKESVLVFDVDGVLAILEFGEHTHFRLNDDDWNKEILNGKNFYTEDKVSKKMQDFLKTKNMKMIYVITKSYSDKEGLQKRKYVNKYYGILEENVYYVESNKDKLSKINEIKEKYKNLDDEKVIMIDDTVEVLNDVMENSNFSTCHISSFLDI